MTGRRLGRAGLAALLLASARPAGAEEVRRPVTAGAEVDLVPIGITVATRDSGFGAALWLGRWKDRLRLTIHVVHEPESTPDVLSGGQLVPAARRYEATRVGLLYERFLRTEFGGPWAGAGLEVGWVTLGTGTGLSHAEQVNPGAVLALGWNLRVWRGLYVSPSASLHVARTEAAVVQGVRRREDPVRGVASLSIGWSERFP